MPNLLVSRISLDLLFVECLHCPHSCGSFVHIFCHLKKCRAIDETRAWIPCDERHRRQLLDASLTMRLLHLLRFLPIVGIRGTLPTTCSIHCL
jgi:hypothetical protein